MHRRNSMFVFVFGLLSQLGCSSSSDTKPAREPEQQPEEKYLGLETPKDGFQVRSVGTTVEPGGDVEFCEIAELPGKPSQSFFMNSLEIANGKGSHHLIVSIATPGTASDAKLRELNVGDRVPCVGAQIAFGDDLPSAGGIQHPYGRIDLPAGIAQEYAGGSRVVFDYHYFNASQEPVEARSAFNMHLIDAKEVDQLAGGFSFFNWTIDTPPSSKRAFTADCRLQNDATVFRLSRHTHQWGRDFKTWFAGGVEDGKLVWTTPDYNTDTDYAFEGGRLVKAGDGFRFECSYENTENYPLRFGVKASDEMCILFGIIWDSNGAYEPPKEDCQATWRDDAGVTHPASYPGAFPDASEDQAALCLAGAGDARDDCTTCSCNACGELLVKCFTDENCGPIVQCSQKGGDCQATISEHSLGLGLAQQVSACVGTRCSDTCGAATPHHH